MKYLKFFALLVLFTALAIGSSALITSCTNSPTPTEPADLNKGPGPDIDSTAVDDGKGRGAVTAAAGAATWPSSMYDFKWPWAGTYYFYGPEYWKIISGYGVGYHQGNNYHAVDLVRMDGSTTGRRVLAPARGIVKYARWSSSLGWYVRMDHGNGWESVVAHLNCDPQYFVHEGDDLLQGTIIGNAGATGWTGPERGLPAFPHIHFVIYKNGVSQPLTGISGYRSIVVNYQYSSWNIPVSSPTGRTWCP